MMMMTMETLIIMMMMTMETLIIMMMAMEDNLETNYHDLPPMGFSLPASDPTFDLWHRS